MIETNHIRIMFDGDSSVGIFPATFEFREIFMKDQTVPLIFESKERLDDFMKDLAEVVENHITGFSCYYMTSEQWQDLLKKDELLFKKDDYESQNP